MKDIFKFFKYDHPDSIESRVVMDYLITILADNLENGVYKDLSKAIRYVIFYYINIQMEKSWRTGRVIHEFEKVV